MTSVGNENQPLLPQTRSTRSFSTFKEGFGEKTIGWFGGFCLLFNNMTGPGMVLIAPLFQQAGWFTPTLCMLIVMVIATLSSTMMCEAMSRIPGNDKFQGRVELTTLAKFYYGRKGFYITIFLFVISLQAMNIASIIESAQTMDYTIMEVFKTTCGLEFYPHFRFLCVHNDGSSASPFGSFYVLSIGFVVLTILAIPLGYYNLDDNIIVQKIAILLFMLISVEWVAWFLFIGIDFDNIPFWGNDQTQVLGTIIFNYAYVISVPSWVNEKKENVSINKTMWYTSLSATSLFILIGLMGGWAFKFKTDGQDLLDLINETASDPRITLTWFKVLSKITVYLFPIVTQLSSIPIFSIIIRYNLLENTICSRVWANFWAVIFPWVVAIPFYTGNGLALVISWTSLLINGFINFAVPLSLYYMSYKTSFEQRRPHMFVATAGRHNAQLLTVEVTGINSGAAKKPSFSALSQKWKPTIIALTLVIVVSLAILACIAINIYETAIGNGSVA